MPRLMTFRLAFLLLCGTAAGLPMASRSTLLAAAGAGVAPDWPETWDGAPLQPLPLSDRETAWNRDFPGAVARFTDGRREFILRRVTQATRRLHAGADCFRGLGYTVSARPAIRDAQGRQWGGFEARRGDVRLLVRERITDGNGGEWTDVSAWFWSVLLSGAGGPWMAVTAVERAS